jgi:hypothetical protein
MQIPTPCSPITARTRALHPLGPQPGRLSNQHIAGRRHRMVQIRGIDSDGGRSRSSLVPGGNVSCNAAVSARLALPTRCEKSLPSFRPTRDLLPPARGISGPLSLGSLTRTISPLLFARRARMCRAIPPILLTRSANRSIVQLNRRCSCLTRCMLSHPSLFEFFLRPHVLIPAFHLRIPIHWMLARRRCRIERRPRQIILLL